MGAEIIGLERESRLANRSGGPFNILGSSGLRTGPFGIVDEELHTKLSGRRGAQIYLQMGENDPVISGMTLAVEALIRRVRWPVRVAKTVGASRAEKAATRWAGFVKENIGDMSHPWSSVVSEALSMIPFGFAPLEINYKLRLGLAAGRGDQRSRYEDGLIGWRSMPLRGQETIAGWLIDEDGGIQGCVQEVDFQRFTIPIQKLLLFRVRARKNSPVGRSCYRGAYRPWYFLTRLEEIEAVGAERDLVGLLVQEVPIELLLNDNPNSADSALAAKLFKLIVQVRRNQREGLLVPSSKRSDGSESGYRTRTLETNGKRAIDIDESIKRHRTNMAISFLGQFLLLGQDSRGGSRALGGPMINLFVRALEYLTGEIQDVLNMFAIPRLMELNGVPQELWPRIQRTPVPPESAETFAKILKLLGDANILPGNAKEMVEEVMEHELQAG